MKKLYKYIGPELFDLIFSGAECAIRFIWTVNPVLTGQQIRN